MHRQAINFIRYGLLFAPVFFGVVDFYNSQTTTYSLSIANYVGLTSVDAVRWMCLCVLFSLVALFSNAVFNLKWRRSEFNLVGLRGYSFDRINFYFKLVFISISIYKALFIFSFGVLKFLLMARVGEIEIGSLLYFILMMFPLVLAYDIAKNGFTWTNILSLFMLIFLNLSSGFRVLLIYGGTLILIANYKRLIEVKRATLIGLVFIFSAGLVIYEAARHRLEADNVNIEVQSSIDSLNRTRPLNMLHLIDKRELSLPLFEVTKLFTVPVGMLMDAFGINSNAQIDTRFNLRSVSEPLFRDYLAWRGTPAYEPTGFSIGIVSYSYLFHQELGIILFALFYGGFIASGCKLLVSTFYEVRVLGSATLTATFFCNESPVEASTLFVFALIFLAFMWCLVAIRQSIIDAQRRDRTNQSTPVLN